VKTALLAFLLLASSAQAQVVSSGASLPMLEFQSGNQHPVSFAPGAGYMLSVGFFQEALFGLQWDLLNISAAGFGTALSTPNGAPAGQLQAALEVGTLNNLFAVGAAVPLYGPDGVGVFQGSFKVYPLLTINIPISWSALSPPVGISSGAQGLPRGGTLYLASPVPSIAQ
jgi:hypothetical protein